LDTDIVVVGAGAAGIGAALELRERGLSCVVLEAADRPGGRAFTDTTSLPGHWDQGCQWLHCADVNPLVAWADRLGATYDRTRGFDSVRYRAAGRWLDAEEAHRETEAIADGFGQIYAAAQAGHDVPLSQAVPDRMPFLDTVLRLMSCDDLDRVSALGYGAYEDTDVNWRVLSGFGLLIERMADGLPIRLGQPVTAIEDLARCVRVTASGGTLEARAAIVTCSTNLLASGTIRFSPGPARDLLALFEHVPCGDYEKVAIALTRLPDEVRDVGNLFVSAGIGAEAPYFQIDGGTHPKMTLHMAGGLARDLSAAGAPTMIDFALRHLEAAFGAGIRGTIRATATTGWRRNPLVRGAYSYCRPGHAATRERLIDADTGRVAFAGEAFSRRWQATAHGAYQSGRDVAARLAAAL
jgi:monoamine oxidase